VSRTCKVGGKNTASPPGEDDFSTTPGGLDLACTNRTRVTFACELRGFGYGMAVMSAVYVSWNDRDILCPKITGNHEKMLPLHQEKRVIWKHEEYSDSKQLGIFLSVARSYASFLQSVDNQIRYFRLQQIYTFSLSIRQAVATSPISSTITVESDNTNSVILINALLIT